MHLHQSGRMPVTSGRARFERDPSPVIMRGRILLMIRRDQTTGRQAATGQESRIRRRHAVELNAGDHVRDQIRAIV